MLSDRKIMDERERLLKIIEAEKLNAKQFAAEVGIQAGTVSNIMGGRNKPSLEVMQRVLNRFRTINSDWLILGVGNMYRSAVDIQQQQPTIFDVRPEMPIQVELPLGASAMPKNTAVSGNEAPFAGNSKRPTMAHMPASAAHIVNNKVQRMQTPAYGTKVIEKIVVLYTDGTFEER